MSGRFLPESHYYMNNRDSPGKSVGPAEHSLYLRPSLPLLFMVSLVVHRERFHLVQISVLHFACEALKRPEISRGYSRAKKCDC